MEYGYRLFVTTDALYAIPSNAVEKMWRMVRFPHLLDVAKDSGEMRTSPRCSIVLKESDNSFTPSTISFVILQPYLEVITNNDEITGA
jgi:hypothetical protein